MGARLETARAAGGPLAMVRTAGVRAVVSAAGRGVQAALAEARARVQAAARVPALVLGLAPQRAAGQVPVAARVRRATREWPTVPTGHWFRRPTSLDAALPSFTRCPTTHRHPGPGR